MRRNMTPLIKSTILAAIFIASRASASPPAEATRPQKVMSGDYSALVITLFEDKDIVQSWLPQGLILDQDCPYKNAHPVIILTGVQRNFAMETYFKVYPWWGREYHEVFISIPYLKMEAFPEKPPVHHFVRVYLDQWSATEMGVKRGWPKLLVKIERDAHFYRVLSADQTVMFEAHTDFANAVPLENDNASFAAIRDMLSMPMVLEKPSGGFKVFDFDLHFESAGIHSVSTDLRVREKYLPSLKPIAMNIDGINTSEFGAFYLRTRFTNRKTTY